MINWASKPSINKLPAGMNPVDADLLGSKPSKDPLRLDKLPLETRINLVARMDRWQLCHLGLFLVLPMRPNEAEGLLIGDVSLQSNCLEFGKRLSDINFTKEGTAFTLPFPSELRPLLRACIGGRVEGPLLRSRTSFSGTEAGQSSLDEVRRLYEQALADEPVGSVQAPRDRKELFRRVLRRLGGVSESALNVEFKRLLLALGIDDGETTLYTLRSSVTTAMKNAGISFLDLRYFTSHSINDIMNTYTGVSLGEMTKYFETVSPLLTAIENRAQELGLPVEQLRLPVQQRLSVAECLEI